MSDTESCRILIIDDNRSIHDDYRKVLLRRGSHASLDDLVHRVFGEGPDLVEDTGPRYEIESAYQGREGVEMARQARECGQPFALAFVDMRMPPGWDGLQTIQHLFRADPHILAVICSAYSDHAWSTIVEAINHSDRLRMILRKPFDTSELTEIATELTREWCRAHARGKSDRVGQPESGDVQESGLDAARGYFSVLSTPDRSEFYRQHFAAGGHAVVIAHDVPDLLQQCLRRPPMAVLIDMRTQLKFGISRVECIYNMGVRWPVMRAAIRADGTGKVVCMEPPRTTSLEEALAEIASGDPSWVNDRYRRDFVRIRTTCRVKFMAEGDSSWENGNTLDLGAGGAFIVCYRAIEPGQRLHAEIHDLGPVVLKIQGRVAWGRTWVDGPALPGIGVVFDSDVEEMNALRRALATHSDARHLIHMQ